MSKLYKIISLILLNGIAFGIYLQGYEICLMEKAFVNSNLVYLKDIARIRADDPALLKKIGSVVIGKSPESGLNRYFNKFDILCSLRKNKISTENIKFSGSKNIMVSLGADHISGKNLIIIELKGSRRIKGDNIYLNDITTIIGSDSEIFRMLSDMLIEKSPVPGMTKNFSRNDIIRILRKNRIDIKNIEFRGDESINVFQPAMIITSEIVNKKAKQYLVSNYGWDESNVGIELKTRFNDISLPEGEVEFQFISSPNEKCMGSVTIEMNLIQNGKIAKSLKLSFSVRIFSMVPVAVREISKDEILNAKDLVMEKRDITLTPDMACITGNQINGKIALRKIARGSIFSEKLVATHVIIKKGQQVKMELESGPLQIFTTGKAMDSGGAGEMIRVKNNDSERIVTGFVKDAQTVIVR